MLICGTIAAVIGARKDFAVAGFLLGAVLGIFGIIFVALIPNERRPAAPIAPRNNIQLPN